MTLQSLRLRHFRNFDDMHFHFQAGKNVIIGNNGAGKTNILEALAFPVTYLSEWNPEYHLQRWNSVLSVHYEFKHFSGHYSYEKQSHKKHYQHEQKSVSRFAFQKVYPHVITFHPHMMDLLYGSPSTRRDFLDDILSQAFPDYQKVLRSYKKIISSRNRILSRISEWKSEISELNFWDTEYIKSCLEVYRYRDILSENLRENIKYMKEYFFWKVEHLNYLYISKTPQDERKNYLESYMEANRQKEILQRKTLRGPHLDDFEISVDHIPLTHFASRWEVKSILLWLKFLWGDFILKHSYKSDIIFLIDDILSELDDAHIELIYWYIWERQCIITSIHDIWWNTHKIFI